MEINTITKSVKSEGRLDQVQLKKSSINEVTEEFCNSIGLVGVLNVSVTSIDEFPVITIKEDSDEEIQEYRYNIFIDILHTNYNSNVKMIDNVPVEETERVKLLTVA